MALWIPEIEVHRLLHIVMNTSQHSLEFPAEMLDKLELVMFVNDFWEDQLDHLLELGLLFKGV